MEEIDGVRRYLRHVFFTGPQGEEIRGRLVYDYSKRALSYLVPSTKKGYIQLVLFSGTTETPKPVHLHILVTILIQVIVQYQKTPHSIHKFMQDIPVDNECWFSVQTETFH